MNSAIAYGPLATGITPTALAFSVFTSIGSIESAPLHTTHNVAPSGVTASAEGFLPTGMGVPAVPELADIGVTLDVFATDELWSATNTVWLSGVTASADGAPSTAIGVPAVLVETEIGLTEPE